MRSRSKKLSPKFWIMSEPTNKGKRDNQCNAALSCSAPKAIVDTVKSLIKDRKVDSPSKVIALKILHLCTMDEGGNEEFIVYIEKKLLNRLTVLAKYKKDSNDIEKGATLFGKGPNLRASADFMKLLLLHIQ